MIKQEEWQTWNMMFAMLAHATCGYISFNMRQVGLRKENGTWIVEVILEKDHSDDREEAEEFATELSILSEECTDERVISRILIDNGPMKNFMPFEGFAGPLYRRKE